jgi:Putative peptidoglycan binding domain
MRQIFNCAAMLAFVMLAWGAQPSRHTKKASPKKTATAKKAPARRSSAAKGRSTHVASKKASARPAATKGRSARRAADSRTVARRKGRKSSKPATAAWRTRQTAPTPERYREIQDALAAKGYLSQEDANGVWGSSSVDALKRFQAEQKIESTGKINSLSLIALGLGPKHDAVAVKPPATLADPGRL